MLKIGYMMMRYFFFILVFAALLALGAWQLQRAAEKEAWLSRPTETILLSGHWLSHQQILWENQFFNRQLGYEVLTPFETSDHRMILVDRGWLPMQASSRQTLPTIPPLTENTVEIEGQFFEPALNPWISSAIETDSIDFPLRVQQLNMTEFSQRLGFALEPMVLHLTPSHTAALAKTMPKPAVSPQKHRGYAVQWFSLAAMLLFLSGYYTFKRRSL